MLSPLESGNARIALQNYISLRVALKEEVDQIPADPCWQKLSAQIGGTNVVKDLTLTELGMYECTQTSPADDSDAEPIISVQAVTSPREGLHLTWEPGEPSKKGLPPNPPVNVRLVNIYPLPYLNPTIKILTELADESMLDAARQYSPKIRNSINSWTMSGFRMHKKILAAQRVMMLRSVIRSGIPSDKDMFEFTLANIEELSNFALPDPVAYEELRVGHPTIQTPGVPLQIQLEAGSVLLEIGILLTGIYFWIFYREARVSSNFPASGTLFAAFRRTRASRVIFTLLIIAPALCSLVLAIWLSQYSFSPYMKLILVPAILTICFTAVILQESLSLKTQFVTAAVTRLVRRINLIKSGRHSR